MSKKFSEEQYQEIVQAWENEGGFVTKVVDSVIELVDDFEDVLSYNEALALANPKSREWAHGLYVERESRYYWTSLKKDEYGSHWYLMRDVAVIMMGDERQFGLDEQLTESEVREWGYDPDKFTRHSV